MKLDFSEAEKILKEWIKSENLIKHSYGVSFAMREYAKKFNEDEELWAIVGLLHDLDYEKFPTKEDHPYRGVEYLKERGFPELILNAILSHASYTGVKRETLLQKTLYSVDELVGFIFACAYVQPDKSFKSLKSESVKKKMKDKAFARSVNREEIIEGAKDLNINLLEHIDFVRNALSKYEDLLGFGKKD